MYSPSYYFLYRSGRATMAEHRAALVAHALQQGIKPAAREFQTTVKTVRKWVRRYQQQKRPGLANRCTRPRHCPKAMDEHSRRRLERIYLARRERHYRINAALIRREYRIGYSLPTVLKALRSFGYPGRSTKTATKRDLRHIKAELKVMQRIQIDVKYLDDIPELQPAYQRYRLPRYQYTARCVRTGTLFISYARELSALNSACFLLLLAAHLRSQQFNLAQISIQTDNGSEFAEIWNSLKPSLFTLQLRKEGFAAHRRIPPGAKSWQSDVESSHRLIEEEFYAFCQLRSRADFLRQAQRYQEYFNLARHNRYKGGCPRELVARLRPHTPLDLFRFPVRVLDDEPSLMQHVLRFSA